MTEYDSRPVASFVNSKIDRGLITSLRELY